MRRRDLIAALAGAAALPLAARAQQPALPVIGYLSTEPVEAAPVLASAFRQGLGQTGHSESQNVSIEYGLGDRPEQLTALAADLVRRKVAVIAAMNATTALVAKRATSTIPIVFAIGGDAVRLGLVASLNRPGGNVTGVTFLTQELAGKRLGLLRGLIPGATRIGFLNDPAYPAAEDYLTDLLAAARKIARQVLVSDIRGEDDLEPAFANLAQQMADALVVGPYPLFLTNRDKILSLAQQHRIPTLYNLREYPAAGGLMSYGASMTRGGLWSSRWRRRRGRLALNPWCRLSPGDGDAMPLSRRYSGDDACVASS